MADYDREKWQAEEAARDEAQTAFRDKMSKARERSASNAKRKITRLHNKLKELGHISEFEDEFGESVLERLDKFGSAFNDPEKGRAGDALSMAQRQVVNRMNKKVKELKAKQRVQGDNNAETDFEEEYVRTGWASKPNKGQKPKSSFSKKSSYTPRVRNIEDDIADEEPVAEIAYAHHPSDSNVRPLFARPNKVKNDAQEPTKKTVSKRPFLRLVTSD